MKTEKHEATQPGKEDSGDAEERASLAITLTTGFCVMWRVVMCLLRDRAKEPGGERLFSSRAQLSNHGVSVNGKSRVN